MVEVKKNRIRELRTRKKLSGAEVASSIDISTQYLYDIERSRRTLSAELASKLSDFFGVTTDYLLGKTEVNLYDWIGTPDEQKEDDIIKETPTPYEMDKESERKEIAFYNALETIANRHNMDLNDPRTLELIDKAFDFIKSFGSE